MDKQTALAIGYRQLAVDYNTSPEAFRQEGVTFTAPAMNPGRRPYSDKMPFFEMVTVGLATVIMAEDCLRPALEAWARDTDQGHWLLEFPRLARLAEILAPFGYELTQTFHHYLPTRGFAPAKAPAGLELKWLEAADIQGFYPNKDWPNALQETHRPQRPDHLALAAVEGGRIAAMAGASIDGPGMWQIGIDVTAPYRGRGLGRLLVEGLAYEVERRGAMPFYGTSLSNIHSQNIAWKCGFVPAWVAVSAKRRKADG